MTNFKHYLTFFLAFILAVSCDDENDAKKQGQLELSFSEITSSSGGRLKQNIASVLITIEDASGQTVHNRKKISLYAFDGQYLSEPIALNTGSYSLTEFIVLDENETAIYATPLEGSPLAHLVDDPLPADFTIR